MRLKLSKLEVFAVVAEEGSFSAAAERLHLSQPAVSRHMMELETTLGIRLFKRLRRGVALTPGGEILQEYTTRILWMVGEAEGALTDVTRLAVGQVRLGATPGVSVYLMPGWTRSFTTAYPNLTVGLNTGTTSEIIDALIGGRSDLAVVEGELENLQQDRLQSSTLQDIDLVLIVGKDHDWWHLDAIEARQLTGTPFVTRQPNSRTRVWIDKILSDQDIEPRLVAEFDNPEAIKEAVVSGLGVTILPTYAIAREKKAGLLKTLPIIDLQLKRQLKMLWDRERPFTPVARAFIEHLSINFPTLQSILPPKPEGIFDE